MTARQSDLTPVVDLLHAKGTGPIRARRPIYRDLLPPCNAACPAGENIQAWLALAQAGRIRKAWERLGDNPFPAVHGRVCYHPCESNCNRASSTAGGIHAVERFLGDLAAEQGWTPPPRRRQPASGCWWWAAGRAACRRRTTSPGAATRWRSAMPGRCPAACCISASPPTACRARSLMKEIRADRGHGRADRPRPQGRPTCWPSRPRAASTRCSSLSALRSASRSRSRRGTPRGSTTRWRCCTTSRPAPRRSSGAGSIVYGGGNTAMDAARTARRLGAEEALIVYRRDRAHMPAQGFEADEALRRASRSTG